VSAATPDAIVDLLKWTAERRDQAYSELTKRLAAEKSSQDEISQAEKKLKDTQNERAQAEAKVASAGETADQPARERVKALLQDESAARSALDQARIAAKDAAADRKAAEAIHKSRVDSYQDLLNAVNPRAAATFGKAIMWAFSGERWPQVLTSLVVLGSLWFVWGTMGDQIGNTEFARGMITLMFGVGTIIIALILTLTAILQAGLTAEDRFKYGMQILTVLMGVFGTILGFYFGANKPEGTPPGSSVSAKADEKAKDVAVTKTKDVEKGKDLEKGKTDVDAKTKIDAQKK
jgi:hypothetical protein